MDSGFFAQCNVFLSTVLFDWRPVGASSIVCTKMMCRSAVVTCILVF